MHQPHSRSATCPPSLTAILVSLAAVASPACLDDPDPGDDLIASEQAINGGSLALDWMRLSAVTLTNGCTGTLISPVHVLTASHCLESGAYPGAYAYPDWSLSPDYSQLRFTTSSAVPPGVNWSWKDYYDASGNLADLAVLRLNAQFLPPVTIANLAWQYPGAGITVDAVGRGNHNGQTNPTEILRFVEAQTTDPDHVRGQFRVGYPLTNHGDSGGPLYQTSTRASIGALSAGTGGRDLYTSVPYHLDWILGAIGYAWPGHTPVWSARRTGTIHSSFQAASLRVCSYACDRTGACVAFDYRTTDRTCWLHSQLGSRVWSPYTMTADK